MPIPSTASMKATVRPRTCRMALGLASPSELLIASRSTSEIRRPSRRRVSTVTTRNPRPPNSISSRITHWPSRVKAVLVVRTVSPVTAEAEVAVNSASMKLMRCVVIQGRSSSPVPMPISAASAATRRSGTGRNRFRCSERASCAMPAAFGRLPGVEVMARMRPRGAARAGRPRRSCRPAPAGSRRRDRGAGVPAVGSAPRSRHSAPGCPRAARPGCRAL